MSAGATPASHDGARKTAALLVAMGRPLAQRIVSRLDQQELRLIAGSARAVPPMNRAVLEALVEDFARNFVEQVLPNTPDEEIGAIISGGIGEDAAGRLNDGPRVETPKDCWPLIAAADAARVAEALSGEAGGVLAAALSMMPAALAGKVMAVLEPARKGAAAQNLLSLGPLEPEVTQAIGAEIWAALSVEDPGVQAAANRKKVATILNGLGRDGARDVLAAVAADDPAEARAIENLLFDFDDVLGLDAKARATLFDGIGVDVVVTALGGAEAELRDAVLSSLGARARRMAEAELQNSPPMAAQRVADARRQIADAALMLAETGRISLAKGAADV